MISAAVATQRIAGSAQVLLPAPQLPAPAVVKPRRAPRAAARDRLSDVSFEIRGGHHAGAMALARRRYQQRGLAFGSGGTSKPAPGITVLARQGAELWATLRLGIDSLSGLQADALYAREIDRLRRHGRRIAEITRLAIDAPCHPVALMQALFDKAIEHLRHQPPITDLVVEVHPRHARFYIERFGFAQIGDERLCERVGGAPAVLLHRQLCMKSMALELAS